MYSDSFCGVKPKRLISPMPNQRTLFLYLFSRQVLLLTCVVVELNPSTFHYLDRDYWFITYTYINIFLQLYYTEFFLMHFVRWEGEKRARAFIEYIFVNLYEMRTCLLNQFVPFPLFFNLQQWAQDLRRSLWEIYQ